MRFLNRNENPNALVGLFLLVLLAVFAGPTVLPQLISENVPFIDEGVPCIWLRDGSERASHQSLIGRAASNRTQSPISLRVRTGSLPADFAANFTIAVVVTNETIGTIPILVTDNVLIFDPNANASGLGVVFNNTAPVPLVGESVGTYPASRIRLLGPRQTCVHTVRIPFNSIPGASAISVANATVKAFYRNISAGTAVAGTGEAAIYNTQGLWTGVVESAPQTVAATRQ